MLDYLIIPFTLLAIGWMSGKLSGKLTRKLDAYMHYGMILGGIRRAAAKLFAKNTGIDFTAFELQIKEQVPSDGDILANTAQAYEGLYAMIAAKKKGLMPFTCVKCLGEWVNFPVAIGISLLFGVGGWQIAVVVIVSSIISGDEL